MADYALSLTSDRLTLIPFTSDFIEALADRNAAERLIDAIIPDGWPDTDLAGLLRVYGPWVQADPSRLGYGPWIVIARDRRAVVGSAGFQGTPKEQAIELGFGVHRDYRNRGYASEAARALISWGLSQANVGRIIAKCDPTNAASIRVLDKAGMSRVGEGEGHAAVGTAAASAVIGHNLLLEDRCSPSLIVHGAPVLDLTNSISTAR